MLSSLQICVRPHFACFALGTAAALLSLACMASGAAASVTISSGKTKNIACAVGVCTPTGKSAVLNVTQLENLLATGNVDVTTGGDEATSIVVSASLSWASANSLTLDAYKSITINLPVAVNGTGSLTLTTNDGGKNGMLSFGSSGNVAFLSTANSLTVNGAAYTLVADTTTLASEIASSPGGNYALASSYNATGNGTYVTTTFTGQFEGLGNTISNLGNGVTPNSPTFALFSEVAAGATVANLRLTAVSYSGSGEVDGGLSAFNFGTLSGDSVSGTLQSTNVTLPVVGGLSGDNGGTIVNCQSSVAVAIGNDGEGTAGGLVALNHGSISVSYASGSVAQSTGSDSKIGGLVGYNYDEGTIANSYATGAVTGNSRAKVGGLAGQGSKSIKNSYATGMVTAGSRSKVGGLIGDLIDPTTTVTNSYWDTTTSGIANASQGAGNVSDAPGITGLSSTQLEAGLPAGFSSTIWGETPSINGGLPYLLAISPI